MILLCESLFALSVLEEIVFPNEVILRDFMTFSIIFENFDGQVAFL